MSNSKKVREGKSTKGTLAKGHLCAYPKSRLGDSQLADFRFAKQASILVADKGINTNGATAKVMNLSDWGKRYALALSGRYK